MNFNYAKEVMKNYLVSQLRNKSANSSRVITSDRHIVNVEK